jgi:hypothetical protein
LYCSLELCALYHITLILSRGNLAPNSYCLAFSMREFHCLFAGRVWAISQNAMQFFVNSRLSYGMRLTPLYSYTANTSGSSSTSSAITTPCFIACQCRIFWFPNCQNQLTENGLDKTHWLMAESAALEADTFMVRIA